LHNGRTARGDAPPGLDECGGVAFVAEERLAAGSVAAAGLHVEIDANLHAALSGPAQDVFEVVEARIDPGGVFGEVGVVGPARDLEARHRRAPCRQVRDIRLRGGAARQHASAQRRPPPAPQLGGTCKA